MKIQLAGALLLAASLVRAVPSLGQEGATLTPDSLSYLVSKDVFGARWTIALNVLPDDKRSILALTGNILQANGSVLFVDCFPRPTSPQFVRNPTGRLTFDCKSMGPCTANALACSQGGWRQLTDEKGFSPCGIFFLPGTGDCPAAPAGNGLAAEPMDPESVVVELAEAVAAARHAEDPAADVVAEPSADDPRARTLTADASNHLVTFELFGARWSVSLNLFPTYTAAGSLEKRLRSMTGNLFFADGRTPKFVHCLIRPDSTGTLLDPASVFRFDCRQAPPCATDSPSCAQTDWSPLATDVQLAASTFLPPGGLGIDGSDPGLIVLPPVEGASGLPGVAAPIDQSTSGGGGGLGGSGVAAASGLSPAQRLGAAGACPSQPCSLRIGSCTAVAGVAVEQAGACLCVVASTPPQCVRCGDDSGSSGDPCSFPVGLSLTGRGLCLPFSSATPANACYMAAPDGIVAVSRCGGPAGGSCAPGGCCADDPADGCTEADATATCAGICIDAGDCDPSVEQCGTCKAPAPRSPFVTLRADPEDVLAGEPVALTWSSLEATLCRASRGWAGPRATSGSEVVRPLETTEYVLTCDGPGLSAEAGVIVRVRDGF